jgi:hypothetical protein
MTECLPLLSVSDLYQTCAKVKGAPVGLLEGHPDLCADVFLKLSEKDTKYHRYSMERWTSGLDGPQSRCHKFDGTDYFAFKNVGRQQRFYGFLWHPLQNTNRSFLLCVLTTYAKKKEDRGDPAELDRVRDWMNAPAVKAAIKSHYPDVEPEEE